MRRAVAILLACSCAGIPPRQESEEKANLAFAPASGKAEPCLASAPCAKTEGVWMPTDLAAQTAGWGAGLAECREQLKGCSYVAPEPWVYVLVGVAGAVLGGATVAGAYELRDWLHK